MPDFNRHAIAEPNVHHGVREHVRVASQLSAQVRPADHWLLVPHGFLGLQLLAVERRCLGQGQFVEEVEAAGCCGGPDHTQDCYGPP